ncbi:DNA mismatch repair endonuclease MutL [Glaciecola petra]|uniref:DNA mismatch repair protein MutL n=1 Tax=Glaciecola petra TaxID=3075602 RepID=A0ABU2ZX98_9ALTE|nr:DNA mismatch repair endonuclease MutL [Aestuariibacter sp. P117]MDT0596194.1 DNA mismatch repair endonuclease MutL [Aestuariibacter sp. P117]
MAKDIHIQGNDEDTPIVVLSPQLANQIAAGEVVERPASVVKELMENSLDAGATKITINIEQGGQKRIAIQDNGKGISKQQLGLALSRHATSKIRDIDDLERITSMGFRGEALASISSVSRLTLISKPVNQSAAWQAFAEGTDMAVELKPTAHPDGTSVEVLDLFFNTPARRKFMRTSKTEFQHVEQVVKRIALARTDVEFVVSHNQKKMLRFANNVTLDKRIAQICSNQFIENAVRVDYQFEGIRLHGYCCKIGTGMPTRDYQYTYVNGRMMKDRLLAHAIRQVYEEALAPQKFPAYVLFLDIAPEQIDVNVHPAKHEVRFHESRKIHDVVFKALTEAIGGYSANIEAAQNHDYIKPLQVNPVQDSSPISLIKNDQSTLAIPKSKGSAGYRGETVSKTELKANNDFYQNIAETAASVYPKEPAAGAREVSELTTQGTKESNTNVCLAGNALLMHPYVLIPSQQSKQSSSVLKCIALLDLVTHLLASKIAFSTLPQPLLMPVSVTLEKNIQTNILLDVFERHHFEVLQINKKLVLKQVPSNLRHLPWAAVFADLVAALPVVIEDTNEMFIQALGAAWLSSSVVDNSKLQIWLNELGVEQLNRLPYKIVNIHFDESL